MPSWSRWDARRIDRDHVTIDLQGTEADGSEVVDVSDYLYEVGSGRVVPEPSTTSCAGPRSATCSRSRAPRR